jgi:hypothetical protein
MLKEFSWFLIILAVIFQMFGGFMDIYNKDKVCISKHHLWADSIFLLLVAIALHKLE